MSFSDPTVREKAAATRAAKAAQDKDETPNGDPMTAVLAAMQDQIARLTAERDAAVEKAASAPGAVLARTPDEPKKTDEEPDYLVTVLHGYGVYAAKHKHWVDDTEFTGGVARHVPWSVAKHWARGTRPDGGRLHGRVKVQVLPDDATPYDYAQAVGVPPMEPEKLAAVLDATNLDLLCQTLGPQKARLLADSILARTSGKI